MRSIAGVHLFLFDGIFLMLKANAKTNINVRIKKALKKTLRDLINLPKTPYQTTFYAKD